jgi:hypothetical protein
MKTFRTPDYVCPACGHHLSACTDPIGETVPKPGDLSVCVNCAIFLVLREDLTARQLTNAELIVLAPECRALLERMAHALREAWREFGPPRHD